MILTIGLISDEFGFVLIDQRESIDNEFSKLFEKIAIDLFSFQFDCINMII